MTTEGSVTFRSLGKRKNKQHSLSPPSVLRLFFLLLHFFPHSKSLHCIVFPLIFIRRYPPTTTTTIPLSISFFCFCLPRPLLCQRFTLDIQLLAGHSIVISFGAAPIQLPSPPAPLATSNSHSNYIGGRLQRCRPGKMLFSNSSGAANLI